MSARALAFCCVLVLLSGCSDPAPPADADPDTPGVQEEAAPWTVALPPWQVGDWWSHHWKFEGNGAPDFVVKTIVAGNASGTYTFATDNASTAAQHGAFFFMDLGSMRPDGMMVAGDFAFPWYQFPLFDNKTWSAAEVNVGNGFEPVTRQLDFTVRQMGTGNGAHFMVEGRQAGDLYVRYDYQPDLGWFSEFTTWSVDDNGTESLVYTITNEGKGSGYTGAVFGAVGEMLVNEQPFTHVGNTNPPAATVTFATGSHTHVFALMFSFGAAGGHLTQLVAPDGQHWEAAGAGDADGNPVTSPVPVPVTSGLQLFVPAQDGDWRVNFGGAGVVAGGGCFLWGITIDEASL